MRDRLRLSEQIAGLSEHLGDRLACGERRLPGQLLIVGYRLGSGGGGDPFRDLALQTAIAGDDRAGGQLKLTPPRDVGEVTEGTHHGDAGALLRLGQLVGTHVDGHAEQRGDDLGAEVVLVALIIRVSDERRHRRDELRTRGDDHDRLNRRVSRAVSSSRVERDPVVCAFALPVLQLSLRHSGAEGDVPHRRGFLRVHMTAGEVLEERPLRHSAAVGVDGAVGVIPVDREAHRAEQRFEYLTIGAGELLAQFDEVPARDRYEVPWVPRRLGGRREAWVVRQSRLAAHSVVVLGAALSRQAVVVPAEGVEDVLAHHPLIAGDDVGLGVGEDVPHMQRSRRRRRGSVDRVDLLAGGLRVEGVGLLLGPAGVPLVLQAFESGSVREVHRVMCA